MSRMLPACSACLASPITALSGVLFNKRLVKAVFARCEEHGQGGTQVRRCMSYTFGYWVMDLF